MADNSTDYIHEPLLQIMAANPQAFSKSEMLYAANRLLPTTMKSTKKFLAKYRGNILHELILEHSDAPYYYIAPKFFVEILRAMPQEKFKAYAGCANPFVGYSYRVKWKVDDYVVRKFAESMYDSCTAILTSRARASSNFPIGHGSRITGPIRATLMTSLSICISTSWPSCRSSVPISNIRTSL